MKTATISLRVPVDFKAELLATCNAKNVSMTDLCLSRLTPNPNIAPINAQVLQKLSNGGKVVMPSSDVVIPSELTNVLSLTGGTLVGILVYKALKTSLQTNNPEWTDEKIEALSVGVGLASALLAGYGIKEISKSING